MISISYLCSANKMIKNFKTFKTMANEISTITKKVALGAAKLASKELGKVKIIRTIRKYNPRTREMEVTEKGTLNHFETVQDALDYLSDSLLPRAYKGGWKYNCLHSDLYGLGGIVAHKSSLMTIEFKLWTPWGI